ncbi:hypothetical protein Slin14017_G054240 [Septoria linicola]|nr:hypothetical protein Slin14017_G054240 [Septoria linicola]
MSTLDTLVIFLAFTLIFTPLLYCSTAIFLNALHNPPNPALPAAATIDTSHIEVGGGGGGGAAGAQY